MAQIEKLKPLHPNCKKAIARGRRLDDQYGAGADLDVMAQFVAQEVWAAALREAKERAAKAKLTPREKATRDALEKLTHAVLVHLHDMDEVMKLPITEGERGKLVATILNRLDQANDLVRYFTLGVDYRKDKKSPVPSRETGLEEVFVLRVGTDADHLYLVRDTKNPGLWAIRKGVGSGLPSSWTRQREWEVDPWPLPKSFVKRARWSLVDARMEAVRILAESQEMRTSAAPTDHS